MLKWGYGRVIKMVMNRTKIDWCDYSWNPVVGCKTGCPYCYARNITKRFPKNFPNGFEPTFYEGRLDQPLKKKKPAKIFVCSMSDLFGPWVPEFWIRDVWTTMRNADWHTFLLLTKYPKNIIGYHWPPNVWIGATATDQKMADDACKAFQERQKKDHYKDNPSFLSCEPLLNPIIPKSKIDWLIIGACSYPKPKQPKWEWVKNLTTWADKNNIPTFYKDNLNLPKGVERRREFPKERIVT